MSWHMKILFTGFVFAFLTMFVSVYGVDCIYITNEVSDIAGNLCAVFIILMLLIGSARNLIPESIKDEFPWIAEDEPYLLKARMKVYRKILRKILVKTSIISKDRAVNDDLEIKIGDMMTFFIAEDFVIINLVIAALISLIKFIANEGI